jgi:hypothetical protein
MRGHGFYESEPVVLGIWPGLKEPVLIDGHMSIRAVSEAGITKVPFVLVEFFILPKSPALLIDCGLVITMILLDSEDLVQYSYRVSTSLFPLNARSGLSFFSTDSALQNGGKRSPG